MMNGRVFDSGILTVFGMPTFFNFVSLYIWNHYFEAIIPYLHEPDVRECYYKMELLSDEGVRTTIKEVKIFLDEETPGITMGVLVKGIRSIEAYKPSCEFTKHAIKRGDIKRAGLSEKFLKGEYQLSSEFMNKVLLPRTKKTFIAFVTYFSWKSWMN